MVTPDLIEWKERVAKFSDEGQLFRHFVVSKAVGGTPFERYVAPRYIAVGLTALLNLLVIWLFASSLHLQSALRQPEVHATIFSAPVIAGLNPPEVHLLSPDVMLAPVPDIAIAQDTRSSSISVTSMSQVLAPRPDPQHVNASPGLPAAFAKLGSNVSLILRIFVQPNGSVSEVEISQSSGDGRLDQFAIDYVKTHWRFLPALVGGAAIADWTTVLVPFKS